MSQIWQREEIYFITCVTAFRQETLTDETIVACLKNEWENGLIFYGWATGEYVIMPDHVHFFCRATEFAKVSIQNNVQRWKEWTTKRARATGIFQGQRLWQPGFHDRLIRNREELDQKRDYMFLNPVRKGLVKDPNDWPYQGDLNMYRSL